MLETIVSLFFQLHYTDASYELTDTRGDNYLVAAVSSSEDYFFCGFHLLDETSKSFTASCDVPFGESYAYSVVDDRELVDIKRNLFSAADILGHLDFYFESQTALEEFLADPDKVDLFYEKLDFTRGEYGNTWTVGLQPMFDEYRFDDLFLSMANVSMLWDKSDSTFHIYNGHDVIKESSNDLNNGIVTVNRKILFLSLNPYGGFSVQKLVPETDADDYLVYEGTFSTPLGDGEENTYTYCKISVTGLDNLPTAKFVMEWADKKIEGTTPMLLVVSREAEIRHTSLQEHTVENAFEEISKFLREEIPKESIDEYIEHLTVIRDDK